MLNFKLIKYFLITVLVIPSIYLLALLILSITNKPVIESIDFDESIYHEHKMLFDNLKDLIAYLISQNQKNILFSPGYPSTTEYKNFEDRGEHFNKCIQRIIY